MAPPFRAEQIGSLIRPQDLLGARLSSSRNGVYLASSVPEELQRLTEQEIAKAVKQQLALSIRPITTGEYERHIFYSGFFEHLQGFQWMLKVPIPEGFRTGLGTISTMQKLGVKTREEMVAVDKIRHVRSAYLSEWEYLRSLLPQEQWKECKLTMPPITWPHMHLAVGTAYTPSSPYATDREYFSDLAAAYATEFQVLYDAGLRSIQIDDPALTFFVTDEFQLGCIADGVDPDALLGLYIWAHNQCLANRPADLHVGLHLCRGNMPNSTHLASGSYERIAGRLFNEMHYDTFYLEYDTDRAGDFQPLRHLPVGKNVVLGVVSTKTAELESLDVLENRVYEAADEIAKGQGRSREDVLRDAVGVSPQCGFASVSHGHGKGMTMEPIDQPAWRYDIVVSGPNVGANLGSKVQISSTVGAASYAASMGLPALAFSGTTGSERAWTVSPVPSYSTIYADLATTLSQAIIASGTPYLPDDIRLNVNFPAVGSSSCTSADDFDFVLRALLLAAETMSTLVVALACPLSHLLLAPAVGATLVSRWRIVISRIRTRPFRLLSWIS